MATKKKTIFDNSYPTPTPVDNTSMSKADVPPSSVVNPMPPPTQLYEPDKTQGSMKQLYEDIQRNEKAPAGYHVAGTWNNEGQKPILSQEQQWQQELDMSSAKAKWMAEHTPTPPPNLTPQEQSQIGQLDPSIVNGYDPMTKDIQNNIDARNIEKGLNPDGTPLTIPEGPLLDSLQAATIRNTGWIPRLNQLTSFVGKVPGGTSVINALSSDRNTRDYLKDYSNADNLEQIRKNINVADGQISDAIQYAKLSENTPENTKIVNRIYTEALSKKKSYIKLLTQIAQSDQRAYTDSIKYDLTELNLYFDGDKTKGILPGKIIDDNALYVALNKPTLKYLPSTRGATNG